MEKSYDELKDMLTREDRSHGEEHGDFLLSAETTKGDACPECQGWGTLNNGKACKTCTGGNQ